MAVANKLVSKEYLYEEDRFLVGYSLRQGSFDMPQNHMHDCYEVYFLLAGQRKYFIRDRLYMIEKGDIVLIPKYFQHRTLNAGPYHERLLLNFDESFLKGFMDRSKAQQTPLYLHQYWENAPLTLRLRPEDRHEVKSLCYRMIKEMSDKPSGFEYYLKALAMELLVYISRCAEKYGLSVAAPSDSPLHHKISEISTYVQENYMKPLTLSHLSERFYFSTWYLSRIFKEISGYSFVQYLHQVRINEAQRLLRETDRKVLHISEEIGFESVAHFGRVFKQTVNLTPIQYRRMLHVEKRPVYLDKTSSASSSNERNLEP